MVVGLKNIPVLHTVNESAINIKALRVGRD
jgi:hypothetical protein